MNYIGSKNKLFPFIHSTINQVVGKDLSQITLCDLFAGTGIVGRNFKSAVHTVIANDVEYYSYVLNKNYIGNTRFFEYEILVQTLQNLPLKKGFIFEEYAQGGRAGRSYFTSQNGQKIDAIRSKIEDWYQAAEISENQYYFLLATLLESADRVANTASVYGAYLKHIKKAASKPLVLQPALFEATTTRHQVHQQDSNHLIKHLEGDVLYLDPPYNARQYGANYHLLTTIAKYDTFVPRGKTGLRDYFKSDYCKKGVVLQSFEELVKQSKFNYLFLSYNNEGLMSQKEVEHIMKKYGRYAVATKKYQRFKADKTENRNHKAQSTVEYIHILEK